MERSRYERVVAWRRVKDAITSGRHEEIASSVVRSVLSKLGFPNPDDFAVGARETTRVREVHAERFVVDIPIGQGDDQSSIRMTIDVVDRSETSMPAGFRTTWMFRCYGETLELFDDTSLDKIAEVVFHGMMTP